MINENLYELMESVLESIYAALVVDADGKIAYINKKYAEINQVDATEARGRPVEDIIPRTRMRTVVATGQEEIGSVYEMKNGVPIVCNRIPLRKNGKIIGAVPLPPLPKWTNSACSSSRSSV